jgi:hypothetical protein
LSSLLFVIPEGNLHLLLPFGLSFRRNLHWLIAPFLLIAQQNPPLPLPVPPVTHLW